MLNTALTSLSWGVCLYNFRFFFWTGVTPTLEISLLELWETPASGTGLKADIWVSFRMLASVLLVAALFRDTDLEVILILKVRKRVCFNITYWQPLCPCLRGPRQTCWTSWSLWPSCWRWPPEVGLRQAHSPCCCPRNLRGWPCCGWSDSRVLYHDLPSSAWPRECPRWGCCQSCCRQPRHQSCCCCHLEDTRSEMEDWWSPGSLPASGDACWSHGTQQ